MKATAKKTSSVKRIRANKELTKNDILKVDDKERQCVEVPEWGGVVYVGVMSAQARALHEKLIGSQELDEGGNPKLNIYEFVFSLLTATVSDKDGNLLFSQKDMEDLATRSINVLKRLHEIAFKLNYLGDGGIEDAAKN